MYQIVSIMRFIILLGFFSVQAASGPTVQRALSLTKELQSPQIVKGYALKGMLTTVMKLYPDLPAHKAILLSPLIAEMSRDWALNAYGTFELVPLTKQKADGTFEIVPGRLEQKFNTATPLNKITRMLFNVTDQVMAPTKQPSNPFLGFDAKTVARMMQVLHKEGVGGLIKVLQSKYEAGRKPIKSRGKASSVAPTDDMVEQWFNTYNEISISGKNNFGVFKKKIKGFVSLLINLDREATAPENKAQNVEDLSKLLMTYIFFKDKAEGGLNLAYSIPEYFKALGSADFKAEYETMNTLERLDKIFKGTSTHSSHLKPDAHGIEQVAFYLEDKIYGGVQALQAPYTTFKSTPTTDPSNRFNGGEFPYCVEATIRSIINLILYDPVTGKLNVQLLSVPAQESMDPEMKAFLEKYNDPLALHYYQETEVEFLRLMSGIEEVLYKQDAPQGKFEISGLHGAKNILAVLNHVFGREAETLEALATMISENISGRTITFSPTDSGYDLRVSNATSIIAEGSLVDKEGVDHTAFLVKSSGLFDILESKEFIPLVTSANKFLEGKEDLFSICFTDKTLHPDWSSDQPSPFVFVMRKGLTEVLKTMLQYETKPIQYKKLLLQAINLSDSRELVAFILSHITNPQYESLLRTALFEKKENFIDLFLPHVTELSPATFFLLISSGKVDLALIEQLLAHLVHPDYNALLTEAIKLESLPLVQLFIKKGATVSPQNIGVAFEKKDIDLIILLYPHFPDLNYSSLLTTAIRLKSMRLVNFCINKGVTVEKIHFFNAIAEKEYSIVKALVDKEFTIEYKDILHAIKTKNVEITLLLFHRYSSEKNLGECLATAISSQSPELVQFFLNEGAFVNSAIPYQKNIASPIEEITPLTAAIRTCKVATSDDSFHIITLLIQNKAIITRENLAQAKALSTLKVFDFLEHEYTTQQYGFYLTEEERRCVTGSA